MDYRRFDAFFCICKKPIVTILQVQYLSVNTGIEHNRKKEKNSGFTLKNLSNAVNASTSPTNKQHHPNASPGSEQVVVVKKISWFERLKKKWKVTGTQLVLILCVFALTGTTTAYITRMITTWMQLQSHEILYWVMKIVILVFGYQVLILLFSIPFGQFAFFWNYEKKLLRWLGIGKKDSGESSKNPAA